MLFQKTKYQIAILCITIMAAISFIFYASHYRTSITINIISTLTGFIFAFVVIYTYMIKNTEHELTNIINNKWAYILIMLIIFLCKIIMAYNFKGLPGDMEPIMDYPIFTLQVLQIIRRGIFMYYI